MSELYFDKCPSCVGFMHRVPRWSILFFGIGLIGFVASPLPAQAQWKLESNAPKDSGAQKSAAAKSAAAKSTKRPAKKGTEQASAEVSANLEQVAPSYSKSQAKPDSQAKPNREDKPNKPVGMRVVENDNQRFVHVPRATVRCGPGADYYPTGVLVKGTAVEVYVETDDGWSGIRPPAGSHNWVQADALYLMPGGRVAEVSQDSVPAWVGSDAVKNETLLYQTELVKTQTVGILGEAYRGQGDEKKLWFRISPPQGEFRWIKTSMIGLEPIAKEPEEGVEPEVFKSDNLVAQAAYQESTDSKLAWSDEEEQTQRVQQQIQQEQQQMRNSILAKSPGAKAGSKPQAIPNRTKNSGRPSSPSPNGRSASVASPKPKNDPWQLIHQRKVGPEETDSMNHVLGIFGLSLVDPNNIQGHPQQGRMRQNPNPGVPYANAQPNPPSNSLLAQMAGRNSLGPSSSAIAGIEHLPRPSGRYSKGANPPFQYSPLDALAAAPDSVSSSDALGVSTASYSPYDSIDKSVSPYAGSYASSDTRTNPSSQDEVEAFQTPQIQDALTQLSVIVSRPSEQWNLAPLRDSAKMWIERGETPLVRGEARLLLDRIERFESVRQRSSMMPLNPPTNYSEAVALRTPASESEMTGWLVAVHTSLPGQPEFALTDDLGNVKAYVRPTTGLNLRRYVQQPVTVFGPQGFLPNLNAKQVVADRVVRLR